MIGALWPAPGVGALVLASALVATVSGCASPAPPADAPDYRARAVSRSEGGVRVATSVLSAAESEAVYGVPLADRHIQPVWIEVHNDAPQAWWLLSMGIDPHYYPPSEAAELFADGEQGTALTKRFRELAFRNPVPPGTTVSGFVLTGLDEGVKLVQVDLVTRGGLQAFSLLNTVPGFRSDYAARGVFDREARAGEVLQPIDTASELRAALEALPCCVTNEAGDRDGDPLNLVVIGEAGDVFPAFVRRGWQPTEETWTGSVMRMVRSALARERYRYAPVSPLYLYGRPQDLALQRARDNIHQRNHLRLWRSPMRYRGAPVWVGQISRDIGSRLTIHSPYLTTHKIDPDVDEARTALIEDMAYSQGLVTIAFVSGVGAAPREAPRGNLTTDPYYTDGLRAELMFSKAPKALTEIEILPWEKLISNDGRRATSGMAR